VNEKRSNTLELTDQRFEIVHSSKHCWNGIRLRPLIARTKQLF